MYVYICIYIYIYIYITSISDVNRKLNFFQDVWLHRLVPSIYLSICMACSYFALGKLKGQVVCQWPCPKMRLNHQKKFLGHQIGNSGKPDKTCVKTFLLMATGKL